MKGERDYSISQDLFGVAQAFDQLGFKELAKRILQETDCSALQEYLRIAQTHAAVSNKDYVLDDLRMAKLIY